MAYTALVSLSTLEAHQWQLQMKLQMRMQEAQTKKPQTKRKRNECHSWPTKRTNDAVVCNTNMHCSILQFTHINVIGQSLLAQTSVSMPATILYPNTAHSSHAIAESPSMMALLPTSSRHIKHYTNVFRCFVVFCVYISGL